jgi:hypothetical protein
MLDDWRLIPESVMAAGWPLARPNRAGRFGLLGAGFVSGHTPAQAKMHPDTSALIKTVVADFHTADRRIIVRDGSKGSASQTLKIQEKCIQYCSRPAPYWTPRPPPSPRHSKGGRG